MVLLVVKLNIFVFYQTKIWQARVLLETNWTASFGVFLFKSEPNIGWENELKHSKIQYLIFEVPYVYSTNVCVPYI